MGVRWRMTSTSPAGKASERDAPSAVIVRVLPPQTQVLCCLRRHRYRSRRRRRSQRRVEPHEGLVRGLQGVRAAITATRRSLAAAAALHLCRRQGAGRRRGSRGGSRAVSGRRCSGCQGHGSRAVASGGARRIVPATPWVPPLVHDCLKPEQWGRQSDRGRHPSRCGSPCGAPSGAAQRPRRGPRLRRRGAPASHPPPQQQQPRLSRRQLQ